LKRERLEQGQTRLKKMCHTEVDGTFFPFE
jgi:hypothetical protein